MSLLLSQVGGAAPTAPGDDEGWIPRRPTAVAAYAALAIAVVDEMPALAAEDDAWSAPQRTSAAPRSVSPFCTDDDLPVAPAPTIVDEDYVVSSLLPAARPPLLPAFADTDEPAGALYGAFNDDAWMAKVASAAIFARVCAPDTDELATAVAPTIVDDDPWTAPRAVQSSSRAPAPSIDTDETPVLVVEEDAWGLPAVVPTTSNRRALVDTDEMPAHAFEDDQGTIPIPWQPSWRAISFDDVAIGVTPATIVDNDYELWLPRVSVPSSRRWFAFDVENFVNGATPLEDLDIDVTFIDGIATIFVGDVGARFEPVAAATLEEQKTNAGFVGEIATTVEDDDV